MNFIDFGTDEAITAIMLINLKARMNYIRRSIIVINNSLKSTWGIR